jgi:predicted membrane channel-forming protein YqfA (hemolysin III family)
MSKRDLISLFGTMVILLPFLGLPNSISTPIFVILGLLIIFIARSATKKKVSNN